MKLYLAAPWVDKEIMPALALKFTDAGHTITHDWWNCEVIGEGNGRDDILRDYAIHDANGVTNCDILVLFNTKKSEGKAVEQGIAIALDKKIIGIGRLGNGVSTNVFHYLPNYTWVNSVEEALCQLT